MDKKSVVVQLANLTTDTYAGTDEVSYDFQIGEHNGCLLVVEKRKVSSMFEVPDEEDIYKAYGSGAWLVADLVE